MSEFASELALDDLPAIYPAPSERAVRKARGALDGHSARFIGLSPFCVMATAGPDGTVDASPRGGNPGFVHVSGANELLMPDRSGNNRIDSFRNILAGSGYVQLIFFVPGIDETLRVGGNAALTTDAALLADMVEFGKAPRAVLRVSVKEAYFHCGKALMRSRLWSHDAQSDPKTFPNISKIVHDQTKLGEPESTETIVARYKEQL